MDKISVFLVHTQVLFRRGLHAALIRESDIEVVGEAADGEKALSLSKELCPKITILDAKLLSLEGVEFAQEISLGPPAVFLIVIADTDDDNELFLAFRAGAAAFLSGPVTAHDLINTIKRVYRGERPINETLVHKPHSASRIVSQQPAVSSDKTETETPPLPVSEPEVTQMPAHEEAVEAPPKAKQPKVRIAIDKGITSVWIDGKKMARLISLAIRVSHFDTVCQLNAVTYQGRNYRAEFSIGRGDIEIEVPGGFKIRT